MASDPFSLDGIGEIPDPAARAASAPIPAPVAPAEPSLTRADRARRVRAAAVFAIAWIAAVLVASGVRKDLLSGAALGPIVGWITCGAILLAFVLRARARGLPPPARAVQIALWSVPAAFVAGVLVVAAASGAPLTFAQMAWASMRACVVLSVAMALGPLTAASFALRGSFLSAPGWRGAAIGALAGLSGSIGVHAHCPINEVGHLLTAHAAAILVGAAAGGALGHLRGRA